MQQTQSGMEMTPAKTTALCELAESLGIRVRWALDLPERGRYLPGVELIMLRHGMTEARTASTLAHKMAHAHYGDWCTDEKRERRAWRYAAGLLISPAEYARAEALHDSAGAIARELGVTSEVVEAYQVVRSMRAA